MDAGHSRLAGRGDGGRVLTSRTPVAVARTALAATLVALTALGGCTISAPSPVVTAGSSSSAARSAPATASTGGSGGPARGAGCAVAAGSRTAGPGPAPRVGPIREVSCGCAGQNAEAEQATDASWVYETWIGCDGIGFARSTDGGRTFGHPMTIPGSAGSGYFQPAAGKVSGLPRFGWDPAIAVATDGAVYVSYMIFRRGYAHPVVAVSHDHGATFPSVHSALPTAKGNWGDRDFIAVAPDGMVYLTWDYGPSLTTRKANVVIQESADGGKTWSPIMPVSPGFPAHGGGVAAPVIVEPSGRIDVLFWVLAGSGHTVLPGGHVYFTASAGQGSSWSAPVAVGPGAGTISSRVTWIDAALSIDAAGTLYAAWDTQRPGGDIGWLAFSADHGLTWSAPRRVTPDHDSAEHIMAVAGGAADVAYLAWLSDDSPGGFALYARQFSVRSGRKTAPVRVSGKFGNPNVWPGDTIGISALPHGPGQVMVSWGSAVAGQTSQIWAALVALG